MVRNEGISYIVLYFVGVVAFLKFMNKWGRGACISLHLWVYQTYLFLSLSSHPLPCMKSKNLLRIHSNHVD